MKRHRIARLAVAIFSDRRVVSLGELADDGSGQFAQFEDNDFATVEQLVWVRADELAPDEIVLTVPGTNRPHDKAFEQRIIDIVATIPTGRIVIATADDVQDVEHMLKSHALAKRWAKGVTLSYEQEASVRLLAAVRTIENNAAAVAQGEERAREQALKRSAEIARSVEEARAATKH